MSSSQQLPQINNDRNEQPAEFSSEEKAKIEQYKSQVNWNDAGNIIQYGAVSQNQMVAFSENVLRQVRTKDLGTVGDTLAGLITELRTFDKTINGNWLWNLILSLKKKLIRIHAEYNKIEKNVGQVQIQLEKHYQTLLKDMHVFDMLFEQNQQYFRDLSLYIFAGEEKLSDARNRLLPELMAQSGQDNDLQAVQQVDDLKQQIHRFEKKLHDLKLSRMISLQLAPQIRMVQNNSALLAEKIQSSIVNTLPLWRNQMVLALGLVHSQQALEAQQAVNNATNEMLQRNSEMLRNQSSKIARENERGIVDIETIRKINTDLFATVDEIIHIQEEGRQKRSAAEAELRNAENELRSRLERNDNKY